MYNNKNINERVSQKDFIGQNCTSELVTGHRGMLRRPRLDK